MIIGIDVDDTMTNTTEMVRELARREYPNYYGVSVIPPREYKSFYLKYKDYIEENVSLKEHVHEVLNYLKGEGYQIYIVTLSGHGKDTLDMTKKYLDKNNIPYDKIIGGAVNKGRIAKKNKISFFIDDRSIVIKDLIKYKIPYIKMYKEYDENDPYTLAYDWYQIENLLKERI